MKYLPKLETSPGDQAEVPAGGRGGPLEEIAYYSNAREGLGIQFQAAVTASVKKAVANPDGGAPSPKGTRTRLVKGFPFSVVYRANDKELLVVAVAHHRRQPEYWSGRVK